MNKSIKNFKKLKFIKRGLLIVAVILTLFANQVYAASNDPLAVINNLSNLMFSIVEGIGTILLIFSVVQFGLSFKSHDPSQRANSVMGIVGALIVIGARIIINKITG